MKRFVAIALALIMILTISPVTALAEMVPERYETSVHFVAEDDGISNDELFEAYAQREFDAALGIEAPSFYRTSALEAGTLEKEIYDKLKAELAKVAAGTVTSTEITVSLTKAWSKSDLGVTEFISGNSLAPEASAAIDAKLNLVYTCLLADCPVELYWHDKTIGMATLPFSCSISGDNLLVTSITYQFAVAKDYSATGAAGTFATNINKTGAASAAVANAQAIVAANASKADLEKLTAYKDKICELVSYDTSAAASSPSVEGINPWQMIYVFDGDEDTNVVCEGYAKAFQFLCDLSFMSAECHTVSGTMSGGTGAGRHMWNVVTMDDGRNYLVDVTNCDSGTIGAPDKLFMAYTANSADAYQTHTVTVGSQNITFTYDETMKDLFCEGYLDLAATAYGQSSAVSVSLSGNSPVQAGTDVTLTLKVSGTNIMGVEATLDYDEEVLEYRSYNNLLAGWDVATNGNKFIMHGVGNPINQFSDVVSVTFCVKSGTEAGTQLNVAFKDIKVSDGIGERTVGTVTWKGTVAIPPIIPISEENFPDAIFRSYVADNFDTDRDGVLSVAERETVFAIDCDRCNITSLDGIEYFPMLSALFCNSNQLTSIDVSKNPLLFRFECEGNQLEHIDVSNNTALYMFYCGRNQLTSIDLSKNTALEYLSCRGNPLTTLDLSNNTQLKDLNCVECPLTTLDVSHNPALEDLMFGYNQLTSVDVSKNPALKFLSFQDTKLTSIDVSKNLLLEELNCVDNQLTSLDVSKNLSLTRLWCYGNQLSAIDVSKNSALKSLHCGTNQIKALDVSGNSALEELYCYENQLTTIDVSKNSSLKELSCHSNALKTVDVSTNTMLERLHCDDNPLKEVDVSNNTELKALGCGQNQLTTLDVSNNPLLYSLYCHNNQLTTVDVSENPLLEFLNCGGNQLTTIDISKNPLLGYLCCEWNQLTTLDASNNPLLHTLYCHNNQLTTIDISENPLLELLDCQRNPLTSLDISQNEMLISLWCGGNQLNELDVSNNTALVILSCHSNQLTALDTSKNLLLELLDCEFNQLTNIDVSKNAALTRLYCSYNQMTSLDLSANMVLSHLEGYGDRFSVVLDENKQFDLSTLPGNFDVSKASNWKNGTVTGTILTVTDTSSPVIYDYDCGNGDTVCFTLIPQVVAAHYGLAGPNGEMPETWTNGTLADAMIYANGLESGTAYIQLLSDVKTSAPLEFAKNKNTILDLNGYNIDRGLSNAEEAVRNGNVITVNGNLTLCDTSSGDWANQGKITGGYYQFYGGGVEISNTGSFTMNGGAITGNTAALGGGVNVYGYASFVMNGGTISSNAASHNGAGVNVHPDSSFTMNDGSISDNELNETDPARGGGGVCVWYDSTFTMGGGTISENTVNYNGGGVMSYGTFEMSGGTVSGNTACWGGGVQIAKDAAFIMNGGAISKNTATKTAGGIDIKYSATFTMNDGTISENSAEYAGGVCCFGSGIMNGGTISKNTATQMAGGVQVANTFILNNGSISENTAKEAGGIDIGKDVVFTMNGGAICKNTATRIAGGIFIAHRTTVTINDGIISENTAPNGGGVYVGQDGSLAMTGGAISGNSATNSAGGVWLDEYAAFTMTGGTITGNNAAQNGGGLYCVPTAAISLSGMPVISGNTVKDVACNVYLTSGETVAIVGALSDSASIGVTTLSAPMSTSPVIVAQGGGDPSYTLTASDAAKFSSDNGHLVELDSTNNTVVLAKKPGVTVSGTVTSYLSDTNDVTVELWANGSTTADYTATVKGNSANYSIDGVVAGTYTMKVSKAKHCTREYVVTVSNANVQQDAEIWLYGDVTRDGEVNTTDATQIKRYYNGLGSMFGSSDAATEAYRLLVANVYAADGAVNTTDATQIKRYYNGLPSIFDSIP